MTRRDAQTGRVLLAMYRAASDADLVRRSMHAEGYGDEHVEAFLRALEKDAEGNDHG